MRVTSHNGRSGKHGSYNPKHNDRQFDVAKSEHIDAARAMENVYWDYKRGYRVPERDGDDGISFEEIELEFYESTYGEYIENQNARNEMNRHPERNRSIEDLYRNDKTCPEETIYQIGNMEQTVSEETLLDITEEFLEEREKLFGSHVKLLDWALHVDESTPHIHERHVFHCRNKYGELCPQQGKALEELEIPLPDPEKPKGRLNNRKITYDAFCRDLLLRICKKHGLKVEEEAIYGGEKYLEKNDYILQKQQKQISRNEEKNEQLEGVLERYLDEIDVQAQKLEVIQEKTCEADELVSDICDIAFDLVCNGVMEEVVSQVQDKYRDKVYEEYTGLFEEEFPPTIREKMLDVLFKVIKAFEEPVQAIVDNIKYTFRRDFTGMRMRENLQDKVWEHIENKAEYDRQKENDESLSNQLVQTRVRRRGR